MRAAYAIVLTACAMVASAAAPALAAAPSADAILQRAFDNYRAKSSQTTVAMTIHRPTWERRSSVKAWTRGEDDALVRFTAPAKDAGNATLKLGTRHLGLQPQAQPGDQAAGEHDEPVVDGLGLLLQRPFQVGRPILTEYTHRLIATDQSGGHTVWTIEADPEAGRAGRVGQGRLEDPRRQRLRRRDLLRSGHEAGAADDGRQDRARWPGAPTRWS